MKYKIESEAGEDMGIYEGTTKTEALAAMHRAAGYDVKVLDDELVFKGDKDEELCGGLDAWSVKEYKNTLRTLVEAIEENNSMNDGSWSDWEDSYHVQDVYGELEYNNIELNRIAHHFLNALIKTSDLHDTEALVYEALSAINLLECVLTPE